MIPVRKTGRTKRTGRHVHKMKSNTKAENFKEMQVILVNCIARRNITVKTKSKSFQPKLQNEPSE